MIRVPNITIPENVTFSLSRFMRDVWFRSLGTTRTYIIALLYVTCFAHPPAHEPEHDATKIEVDLVGIVKGPRLRQSLGDCQRHHLDLFLAREQSRERGKGRGQQKTHFQTSKRFMMLRRCQIDHDSATLYDAVDPADASVVPDFAGPARS